MARSDSVAWRQTWLIIFGALSFSVLLYLVLGYFTEHDPKPRHINLRVLSTMTPIMVILAPVALLGAVASFRLRVDGKIGENGCPPTLTPQEFQIVTVTALALSQACTLFGYILLRLGAPLQQLVPFALGTLIVNFAFILPRGLKFWNAHEKATTS